MDSQIKKLELLEKIIELEKTEPNDYQFGGKIKNLINFFIQTGEIKENPKGRSL